MAGSKRIKPIIGVTGSIGSGKSTVAGLLQTAGAAVFDSDAAAHRQLRQPEVIATLVDWWGKSILDASGGLDRSAIARIVFADPEGSEGEGSGMPAGALSRLEGLLYPRIERERLAMVRNWDADPHVASIVLDTPKLYEAGLEKHCDRVILVDADPEIRLLRLRASRGWTEPDLRRREKFLKPLDRKRLLADHVIVNNAGIGELRLIVNRIRTAVLADFAGSQSV